MIDISWTEAGYFIGGFVLGNLWAWWRVIATNVGTND